MEYHDYILYICIIVLTGYILYIGKYLNKVVVVLDTQKKFFINTSTQTITINREGSTSTESLSDYQETYMDSHRDYYEKPYHSDNLSITKHHPRKRIHRGKRRWQKDNH